MNTKRNLFALLITIFFCLGSSLAHAVTVLRACYYTNASGQIIGVKVVTNTPSWPWPGQAWIDDGSAFAELLNSPAVSCPDADGVNYDFLFMRATPFPFPDPVVAVTDPVNPPCVTVYVSPTGGLWDATVLQACACPIEPIGGCWQDYDTSHSKRLIQLTFDPIVRYISGLMGDKLYFYKNGVFAGLKPSPGTGGFSWTTSADDFNKDLRFIVDNADLPEGDCFPLSFGTWHKADAIYDNSESWAVASHKEMCQCCTKFNYRMRISSANPSAAFTQTFSAQMITSWLFDDGTPEVAGATVTHTFPVTSIGAEYDVCTRSQYGGTPADSCKRCMRVCIKDPNPTMTNPGPMGTCVSHFDLDIEPGLFKVYGSTGMSLSSGTYEIDFGDLTPVYSDPSGNFSHTYSSAGNYTICVTEKKSVGGFMIDGCKMCMNICIPTLHVAEGRPAPSSVSSVNALFEEHVMLAPNPANDEATLSFSMQKSATATIIITDPLGRVASSVTKPELKVGNHKVTISTAHMATGVYNVTLHSGNQTVTKRLSVIK